jgi:hypothetical protein
MKRSWYNGSEHYLIKIKAENKEGSVNFSFEQQGYVGILRFYGELSSKRKNEFTETLMVSLDNTDYLFFKRGVK